ncbi:unnamed protein product [Adineta steineri]|uniref:J domain-containing protein n=1 Tax=Adineta steineri TaxID=433720 RepID=A0A813YFB4_9BILA|nr:unnamed protein product [Adineta steineri]CAF1041494.1 unnamed protein product [Adineta steineri]CAF1050401.1 unnamed protein product [Adineta steineri]
MDGKTVALAFVKALPKFSRWEIAMLGGVAGTVVKVVIDAGTLVYSAVKNIYLWWKGEVSGKRCVKGITDATAALFGTLLGTYGGALVGTAICPLVGTFIGGFVGGLVGSAVIGKISERLTCKFFDLPKTVALENAYKTLGLTQSSSNGEINSAYRRLALICHPDKGGSAEAWSELETALALIRQAREEGI